MNAPHHCRAVLVILFTLGVASSVHAQGTPPGAADAPGIPVVSEPAAGPAPSDDALAEQLRALQGEVQAMREDAAAAAEEAELAALMAESENEVEPDVEEDLLRIYGFMDMGATRAFLAEDTIFALGAPTKASTFFMGALHTYMDARPHPHWRGLFELRYSNLPHGQQLTLGVNGDPNTNYERVNTQVTDHTNPVGSAPLVLGSINVERAWIEWDRYDYLRVRFGHWLTPFGVWNVDHGSPTLIPLLPPQFMANGALVPRQTGLQVLGTKFLGDWKMDYQVYISNGRTPGQQDLTEDKAVGGHLVFRTGRSNPLALGISGFWGNYADVERNLTSPPEPDHEDVEVVAYNETMLGLDASWDYEGLRLRTEGFAKRLLFEEGKHRPLFTLDFVYEKSRWMWTGYFLASYQLPFGGLEPFAYFEAWHDVGSPYADVTLMYAGGLNIHLTSMTMLKLQYLKATFRGTAGDDETGEDPSKMNSSYAAARLVLSY